jgi:hypothetical protein
MPGNVCLYLKQLHLGKGELLFVCVRRSLPAIPSASSALPSIFETGR